MKWMAVLACAIATVAMIGSVWSSIALRHRWNDASQWEVGIRQGAVYFKTVEGELDDLSRFEFRTEQTGQMTWLPDFSRDEIYCRGGFGGWRCDDIYLLPLWMPLFVAGGWFTIAAYRGRRPPPGHCPTCHYNLTGNTTGVCPECGGKVKPMPNGEVRRVSSEMKTKDAARYREGI